MNSPFFIFLQEKQPLDGILCRPTWAEIDLRALERNFYSLSSLLPAGCRPISVVKANAYGHGAKACTALLLRAGCRHFAVATLEEGIEVRRVSRRLGISSHVLILGYTPAVLAPVLTEWELTQALLSPIYAADLESAARRTGVRPRVHIALNTGMNRIGFAASHSEEFSSTAHAIATLCSHSPLLVTGLFTHLSTPVDTPAGQAQAECFSTLVRQLQKALSRPLFCHVLSSSGVGDRSFSFDGVRLGIALYGGEQTTVPLLPVMHLCTRIVHLHTMKKGDTLGYGGDYTAPAPTTVATLPLGYADGLPRSCSGALVTVHTEKGPFPCPVIGRICMDMCMLDVTSIPAGIGNRVTVFGRNPKDLSSLAARGGTISYELLTRVSARVPRVYRYKTTEGNLT